MFRVAIAYVGWDRSKPIDAPAEGFAETITSLATAFILAFAIKVPMFPFHTWLPDAHTQAPTQGSVILAAILLGVVPDRAGAVREGRAALAEAVAIILPYCRSSMLGRAARAQSITPLRFRAMRTRYAEEERQ